MEILIRVNEKRRGVPLEPSSRKKLACSGPEFLGMRHPSVITSIEALPNADKCGSYEFHGQRSLGIKSVENSSDGPDYTGLDERLNHDLMSSRNSEVVSPVCFSYGFPSRDDLQRISPFNLKRSVENVHPCFGDHTGKLSVGHPFRILYLPSSSLLRFEHHSSTLSLIPPNNNSGVAIFVVEEKDTMCGYCKAALNPDIDLCVKLPFETAHKGQGNGGHFVPVHVPCALKIQASLPGSEALITLSLSFSHLMLVLFHPIPKASQAILSPMWKRSLASERISMHYSRSS